MTFYSNLPNFNMDLFGGMNNWFPASNSFLAQNFGWQLPSFLHFDNFFAMNFNPKMFQTDLWNTTNQQTFFNNSIFGNFTFNTLNQTSSYSGDSYISASNENGTLRIKLADLAKSYVGKVNSDSEGNKLFSNGKAQPWCADFVSYVTKETFGSKLPSSFKSFSSVSSLKQWGETNGCYKNVPASNKAQFIADNIKVGDIMIEKKGGKSHTGIVTKVNSDGSFETIEGNCGNKVAKQSYTADSSTLSGFISLEKYMA